MFIDSHMERLWEGAAALDMDLGITPLRLQQLLYSTLDANGMGQVRARRGAARCAAVRHGASATCIGRMQCVSTAGVAGAHPAWPARAPLAHWLHDTRRRLTTTPSELAPASTGGLLPSATASCAPPRATPCPTHPPPGVRGTHTAHGQPRAQAHALPKPCHHPGEAHHCDRARVEGDDQR
jgi:hypothetical protein